MNIDVVIPRWPDMLEVIWIYAAALLLQLIEGFPHIDAVPQDDGVRQKIQAARLVLQIFIGFAFENPPVPDAQEGLQGPVPTFLSPDANNL